MRQPDHPMVGNYRIAPGQNDREPICHDPRGGVVMNTWRIALVLMVTFAMGSGCAKPDWIQQTLVTVDVTGTWVREGGPA